MTKEESQNLKDDATKKKLEENANVNNKIQKKKSK